VARQSILVVDDEVLIRLHISEELRDAGYRVIEAANGDEAAALLSTVPDVALVLTDLRMSGDVDGLALVRRVRSDFPQIKVALCSSELPPGASPSFDAFFAKPVHIYDLLHGVRQLLPQAERGGSGSR
jgi:CheY-like chemotaxis protein